MGQEWIMKEIVLFKTNESVPKNIMTFMVYFPVEQKESREVQIKHIE